MIEIVEESLNLEGLFKILVVGTPETMGKRSTILGTQRPDVHNPLVEKKRNIVEIEDGRTANNIFFNIRTQNKEQDPLIEEYYNRANGFFIFFDFELRESYEKIKEHYDMITSEAPEDIIGYIIGIPGGFEVSKQEAIDLAHELHCDYFELPLFDSGAYGDLMVSLARALLTKCDLLSENGKE